jgi:hypothetical protein
MSMGLIEVTVRIEPAAGQQYDAIVAELGKAGLCNVLCSRRFLMVHGDVEEGRLDELRQVRGVASVRVAETFRAVGA